MFSRELGHNGADPKHRADMRNLMRCGLAVHGYGDDMAQEFYRMYDQAILGDGLAHHMGVSDH